MSEWVSKLGTFLEKFIIMKMDMGFVYKTQTETLHEFDKFCNNKFPEADIITQDMVLEWLNNSNRKSGTVNARFSALRQFALYIQLSRPDSFVPSTSLRVRREQFICHIMTDKEATRLFDALDHMTNVGTYVHRAQTYQAFFRLLYCAGLRPSEAHKLNRENINWASNTITILASKGHAKRVVPLSGDMAHWLKSYDQSLPSERTPFFSFDGMHRPSIKAFSLCLRTTWKAANPESTGVRLHDFRHTFITKRILEWHKNHADLKRKLPLLMSFVGHKRVEDTLYYFRVIPELCGLLDSVVRVDVIPEEGD